MLNKKISNFVPKQVPAFVREQHPRFVSFIEAYYEFLEKEHPELNISNNNLQEKIEKLRYISDVDFSLEEFEKQFFNGFLPYFSNNPLANKDIIIKNIMPLYLAKGSEKSFKLLFRMLFDESVELSYPRDNILKASDGKWYVQNVLNVFDYFYTLYYGDGETTEYYLPESYDLQDFSVYLNSVETQDFVLFKDYKRIKFNFTPQPGDEIRIDYTNFDASLLKNRQIKGLTSNATCIVEYTNKTRRGAIPYFEFFVDSKNTIGTFSNNEILKSILVENSIPIYFKPYSTLDRIEVLSGGASYNIGDSVAILGTSAEPAIAIVDTIYTGFIENLTIQNGGAGFKINDIIYAKNYPPESFQGTIGTVDSSGVDSANTITVNNDIIANSVSFSIDSIYSFFPQNPTSEVDTVIGECLGNITISDLGPITSLELDISLIKPAENPTFDVLSAKVTEDLRVKDFGIIAKFLITDGGDGYQVGDKLVFVDNGSFMGYGADAEVLEVDGTGSILKIKINNGGLNYDMEQLPSVHVDSQTGANANLSISAIMGDAEKFNMVYSNAPTGRIKTIKILNSGLNYSSTPIIDLSQFGDGNASAQAFINNSLTSLPGKWKTDDGKISNRNIRLQGNDYYIDYSYVISSQVEFKKYKEVIRNLLHPVGLKNYSRYVVPEVNLNSTLSINIESTEDLSYLGVPVDSGIYVNNENITIDMV